MTENVLCSEKTSCLKYWSNLFDILLTLLCALFYITGTISGLALSLEYIERSCVQWALVTLVFLAIPSVAIEVLSLRWCTVDGAFTLHSLALHMTGLGLLTRSFQFIQRSVEFRWKNVSPDYYELRRFSTDLSLLILFAAFLEAAPQLMLQIYICLLHHNISIAAVFSVVSSTICLCLSIVFYFSCQYHVRSNFNYIGLLFQSLWHLGLLSARICSLVLLLLCFKSWFLLFIGVHWLSMFLWIVYQETNQCDNTREELFYNGLGAVIYCFTYFNLKTGNSLWNVICFYSLTILENLTCLTVFLMWFSENSTKLGIVSFSVVVGGTLLGLISMVVYYRFFHPSAMGHDKSLTNKSSQYQFRSLKRISPVLASMDVMEVAKESPSSNADNPAQTDSNDSKLMLSDSVVIVEESDMEEINTLQGWLKEAAREEQMKNMSDLDEAASSVMSAHDYENMAAVNIARAGGLRSWRGYFDIETWLHDDSIVATTSTTSTSQEYVDSIADDYVECKLSMDPVGTFAPSSLDTILEGVESTCSDRSPSRGKQAACSLVATIDQIRITTPVQEDKASRVRRKFSMLRERFEGSNEPPPPPATWCPSPALDEAFTSRRVKDMRTFFLKQLLTPPKLYSLRRKIVAAS